ncbi:MAG: hypothetical protein AUK55_00340 [Syntrophobacteraceae bacterium CG2_30_61_12]|nr:MAG: hypothetical protein AUK55_00340 [Syntrophobacteraceae bacterium CG2_30_61_12]
MKTVMSLIILLTFMIMPGGLFAQQAQTQTPAASAQAQTRTAPEHTMSDQYMKERDEMMSRMQEMDARLDAKIALMDAAKGDQKVEAMAAVLKEMVSQRKEMQEQMMKTHGMGKGRMMENMKPGMGSETGKN